MSYTNFVAAVRLWFRGRRPQPGLRSAEEIRRVLQVERIRADRTGECLSIIVFAPRNPQCAAATWANLGNLLRDRLRVTDEAGWLDDQRVCAVLPFTPSTGAWKVADDVCQLFDGVPPPICTVYSYPTGNLPSSDEDTLLDDGLDESVNSSPVGPAIRPVDRPAPEPLEPLFGRPISGWKRSVDVLGASFGLLMLLPLLPFIALAVKLSSPGPVFFKQRRAGYGGSPFVMWKFRTMRADAEARKAELMALNEQDGPAFKIKRDPRITRIGRILRSTSIDELPQLWNVLKGDMSLVGPRPLPCSEADGCEPWQRRRLDVLPGLTCIWQVKGRSTVSFDDWVRMDVEYIDNQSIGADLKLMLMTVPAMVLRKGAH